MDRSATDKELWSLLSPMQERSLHLGCIASSVFDEVDVLVMYVLQAKTPQVESLEVSSQSWRVWRICGMRTNIRRSSLCRASPKSCQARSEV